MLARLRRLPANIAQLLLPLGSDASSAVPTPAAVPANLPAYELARLPLLTARDALWTLDGAGEDTTSSVRPRSYQPLVIAHQPGVWAGRAWMHCGPLREGVLVVRWDERDEPHAVLHWMPLDGQIRKLDHEQETAK